MTSQPTQLSATWKGIHLLVAWLMLVVSALSALLVWFAAASGDEVWRASFGGLLEWMGSLQIGALVLIGISGRWRALGWGLTGAVVAAALNVLAAISGFTS